MTYKEVAKLSRRMNCFLNNNNEVCKISIDKEQTANDGDNCYLIICFQNNNWVRKQYYHADGTVEEMFSQY